MPERPMARCSWSTVIPAFVASRRLASTSNFLARTNKSGDCFFRPSCRGNFSPYFRRELSVAGQRGSMTTYYTATFPNGTVLKRATASRKYTHAWFACGTRLPGDWADRYGATWSVSGFSGSEALARGALASWLGHRYFGQAGYTTDFSGIAPTVEVDRKPSKATGDHAGQVTRPVKVMRAGRRSKTVAFVATLALAMFGALVLGANVGQSDNNLAVAFEVAQGASQSSAA